MSGPVMFTVEASTDPETVRPTAEASSQWAGGTTIRGLAVSGVMARAAERVVDPRSGLRPVRWTADLSRPVPMAASSVHAEVVRAGRRLNLVDVTLLQAGTVMARARALFLASGPDRDDRIWEPHRSLAQPPPDLLPDTPEPRLYYSESAGWSAQAARHHNDSRKQVWTFPFRVVEGEEPTPFQLAAGNADLASVVAHWGTGGLAYINADITVAMARLPHGSQMGISAAERSVCDGVAIGTALMHDRDGVFGTATVCALWNGDHIVDPGRRDA